MIERVILVGFMCAGKTTVGRLLADTLGWGFVDFDEVIESEQGRTIADIFERDGEAAFRTLEADLTQRLAPRRHTVFAPGGGWITQPELVKLLRPGSLTVWLQVSAETVLQRHRDESPAPHRPRRPLLEPHGESISELLAERTPYYRSADLAIDTEATDPARIAAEIANRLGVSRRTELTK